MSDHARDPSGKNDSGASSVSDPVECDRAEFLATQIRELLDLSDAAVTHEQLAAAVTAKAKAAELRAELDKLRAFEADSKIERTLLEETRAMRRRADASGSHVAALQLLKVERELVAEAEAARLAAERERLEHLTEHEVVSMLVGSLLELPEDLREVVLEQVGAPASGPVH